MTAQPSTVAFTCMFAEKGHNPMPEKAETAQPTAGLMDAIYRRQRHIYDLTRHYYLLGRDMMIDRLNIPASGSVLEIGCGTARNLIATARKYPDAKLYGIDISAEMLKSAETNIRRAGLADRISIAQADAASFDGQALFGSNGFDRIFFSYSLSMIPPWQQALNTAVSNLSPEGALHYVDFSNQQRLPGWFGRLLRAWLSKFHVTPRQELGHELAAIAKTRGGSTDVLSVYRDYAVLGSLTLGVQQI